MIADVIPPAQVASPVRPVRSWNVRDVRGQQRDVLMESALCGSQHLLHGTLGYADAVWIAEKAESMLRGREYLVDSRDVQKLLEVSRQSSYECEYVALADFKGLQLVSGDRKLARLFPNVVLQEDFAR